MMRLGKAGRGPGSVSGWSHRPDPAKVMAFFLIVALILQVGPAHAQIFDAAMDVIDQATLSFEEVVGGFILLCGLVLAWVIGMKNPGFGIITGIAVLLFAGMVANNEDIASEIGFRGGR